MKTVVIAVIANSGHPYPDIVKGSLATWDSPAVPGVDTLFYFDRDWKERLPKTLAVNADGGLLTMGHRDLLAYDWLLRHKQWDYMARVNASCYVRKRKLSEYAQSLPATGLYRGLVATMPDGRKYVWGGGQYIMSRDVVKALVDHRSQWNHREMEDVAQSLLVKQLGFSYDGQGRLCAVHKRPGDYLCLTYFDGSGGGFECQNLSEVPTKAGDHHFFRIKQDGNRPQGDLAVMNELHRLGL